MGRYFLLYFSLISLFCLGAKFYEISKDESQIIHWSLADFEIDFHSNSWVMVIPENFHFSKADNKTLVNQEKFITTEPKRRPEESTGDLLRYVSENKQVVDLYCVEKAFYDCLSFLVHYPQFRRQIEKLFVIFPDSNIQEVRMNDSSVLLASKGKEVSVLFKSALWLYGLVFEIENSYDIFTGRSKREYVAQNKAEIQNLAGKIEILNSIPNRPISNQ